MPELATKPATAPPGAGAPLRAGKAGVEPAASFLDALFPPTPPIAGERQEDATPGKALPDETTHDDPLIAFGFGTAVALPMAAVPVKGGGAQTVGMAPPVSPGQVAGQIPSGPTLLRDQQPAALADAQTPKSDALPGVGPGPVEEPAQLGPGLRRGGDTAVAVSTTAAPSIEIAPRGSSNLSRPEQTRDIAAPSALPTAATAQPASDPRTGRASEVFARAMAAVTRPLRRRDDERRPDAVDSATPAATTITVAASEPATLAAPTDRALHRMVDHIERLRDDADAADTRIRLKPDALGAVDVAVSREGEAVLVHFTAGSAETRQLLSDAQPRLEALAAARGLALAGTSVGGGDAQQRSGHPSAPKLPSAPARAAAALDDDSIDIRIA